MITRHANYRAARPGGGVSAPAPIPLPLQESGDCPCEARGQQEFAGAARRTNKGCTRRGQGLQARKIFPSRRMPFSINSPDTRVTEAWSSLLYAGLRLPSPARRVPTEWVRGSYV